MIGYVCLPRVGTESPGDRLLCKVARNLEAEGIALAGAVQVGSTCRADEMRLEFLGTVDDSQVISQDLGQTSTSCRLDSGALELAVERIASALPNARLVILNKFGKQEAAGRGMRPLIAEALERGLPVLIYVVPEALDEFRAFAGDMAKMLTAATAEDWCRSAVAA